MCHGIFSSFSWRFGLVKNKRDGEYVLAWLGMESIHTLKETMHFIVFSQFLVVIFNVGMK